MERRRPRVVPRKRAPAGDRDLGESRVRAARLERGLSQAELAEATGLTRQAVYSIESNRYLPNVTTALQLARTLNRRVEDLFGLEPAGTVLDGELLRQMPSSVLAAEARCA